jgi:hypothetical protein
MANFSVALPIQMGLLFVLFCWTTGSTAGTDFPLEEEFRQLKENYVRKSKLCKKIQISFSRFCIVR